MAYDWDNLRLACLSVNGRKTDFDTILDPFEVKNHTFHLELVTGRIYPNPKRPRAARVEAQDTIDLLGLDEQIYREKRSRDYLEYRRGDYTADHLRRYSPFVWLEAQRQGLL